MVGWWAGGGEPQRHGCVCPVLVCAGRPRSLRAPHNVCAPRASSRPALPCAAPPPRTLRHHTPHGHPHEKSSRVDGDHRYAWAGLFVAGRHRFPCGGPHTICAPLGGAEGACCHPGTQPPPLCPLWMSRAVQDDEGRTALLFAVEVGCACLANAAFFGCCTGLFFPFFPMGHGPAATIVSGAAASM